MNFQFVKNSLKMNYLSVKKSNFATLILWIDMESVDVNVTSASK